MLHFVTSAVAFQCLQDFYAGKDYLCRCSDGVSDGNRFVEMGQEWEFTMKSWGVNGWGW